MQEKDTEAVNDQRRRHNRVSKMKNSIVALLTGWVVLSMILIICLFVLLFHTRSQVNELKVQIENGLSVNISDLEVENSEMSDAQSSQVPLYSEEDGYEPVEPVASGISEEENRAESTDVHKVYLTFEDGPSEYTAEILDVLKEKGVQATFFVTGQEGEEAHELYKRIVREGHTLGMHSYSNKYSTIYHSEDNFKEDVTKLRAYLLGITGVEAVYYRFPGGSSNQITNVPMENFIHYLNQEGIVYYDWNVSSGDATMNAYTADEIVANVTEDVVKYKTSIVLLHDGKDAAITVEALEAVIDALRAMNAEILPITEDTSVIQAVKADTVE